MCADATEELVDGKTLHLLESADQKLTAATEERIEFLPHYHTWCSVACTSTTPVKDRRRCVSLHAPLCRLLGSV